jgi:hypothetical protein
MQKNWKFAPNYGVEKVNLEKTLFIAFYLGMIK